MKLFCYVYYRILPECTAEATAAARTIIDSMRAISGVDARRMTKVGEPLLWMEVYEGIENLEQFQSVMHQAVEQSGLGRWLADEGKRHTEVFQCA